MIALSPLGIPGPQSLVPAQLGYASGAVLPTLAGAVNTRNLLASVGPDPTYGAVRIPTPYRSDSGEALIALPLDPRVTRGTVAAYLDLSRKVLRAAFGLYADKLRFNPPLKFPLGIDLPDGPSGWSIEGLNDALVSLGNPSTGATLEIAGHVDHSSIEAGWCGNGVAVSQKTSIIDHGPDVFTEGYLVKFNSTRGLAILLGMRGATDIDVALRVAKMVYQSSQYDITELGDLRREDEDDDGIVFRSERQVEDGPPFIASLLTIKILGPSDAIERGIEVCINRRGETEGAWPLVPSLRERLWKSAVAMVSGRHPA